MRLKNKKTGEIIETDYQLSISIPDDEKFYGCKTYNQIKGFDSLAELNEEWEDYEEPKKYWYIYGDGVLSAEDNNDFGANHFKAVGDYFETKEEAEKAVDKLKAWKRLKDKGFRFNGITETSLGMDCIQFEIGNDFYKEQSLRNSELNKDLVLLFSGGEE